MGHPRGRAGRRRGDRLLPLARASRRARGRAARRGDDDRGGARRSTGATGAPAPPTPPAEPGAPPVTPPAPPAGSYPTEKAKLEAAVPKFLAVAEQYPSTDAGLAGRYHLAASLGELGRRADAEKRYQEVIDKDRSGIYGQMARLGLAELQVDGAQYDRAITIYKELTADRDSRLPLDGVLMRLGQAYARAGKTADARQTFTRVVDEFPESQYAPQAKEELSKLAPANTGTPG